MTWYTVELRGDVREVYDVEASSADEARANWYNGILRVSEAEGMDVVSVREERED